MPPRNEPSTARISAPAVKVLVISKKVDKNRENLLKRDNEERSNIPNATLPFWEASRRSIKRTVEIMIISLLSFLVATRCNPSISGFIYKEVYQIVQNNDMDSRMQDNRVQTVMLTDRFANRKEEYDHRDKKR
jgi:hypothetical protein